MTIRCTLITASIYFDAVVKFAADLCIVGTNAIRSTKFPETNPF